MGNIRPIALVPAMAKWKELCIFDRYDFYMEENEIVDPNQAAFEKFNSQLGLLIPVNEWITENLNKNYVVSHSLTDYMKAFDKLSRLISLYLLVDTKIEGPLLWYLSEQILERKSSARIAGALSKQIFQ